MSLCKPVKRDVVIGHQCRIECGRATEGGGQTIFDPAVCRQIGCPLDRSRIFRQIGRRDPADGQPLLGDIVEIDRDRGRISEPLRIGHLNRQRETGRCFKVQGAGVVDLERAAIGINGERRYWCCRRESQRSTANFPDRWRIRFLPERHWNCFH